MPPNHRPFLAVMLLTLLVLPATTQAITVSGHATAECIGLVQGMRLSLYSYDPVNRYFSQTQTDADGNYEFTNVPVSTRGGRLSITLPNGTRLISPSTANVQLALVQDEMLDVQLACNIATIYGRVTSDCDGPLPGVTVFLDLPDGSPPRATITSETGDYSFSGVSSLGYVRLRVDPPQGYSVQSGSPSSFPIWTTSILRNVGLLCPPTVVYFRDFEQDNHGWMPVSRTGVSYGDYWQRTTDGLRTVLWCGQENSDPCAGVTLPGYGNWWHQRLVKRVELPPGSRMTIAHQYDTEPDCDFCFIEISPADEEDFTILASYSGSSMGYHQSIVDLSAYAGMFDLRLRFESDGMASDQDGYLDTNGAWRIDRIEIPGVLIDEFDTGSTVYQTGFDPPAFSTGRLHGQDGWDSDNSDLVTLQGAVVRTGLHAVKIDRSNGIGGNGAYHWFGYDALNQTVALRIDALLTEPESELYSYWSVLGTYLGDDGIHVNINWDNEIHVITSPGPSPITHPTGVYIVRGQWNHLEQVLDFRTRTAEVYYNSERVFSGEFGGTSNEILFFGISGQWDGTEDIGYFDNFSMVSDVPEEPIDTGFDGWTVPPRVGDELAQYRLQSNPICEPAGGGSCLDGMGRSWVAYDPATGEIPTNPQWLLDKGQHIEIGIESGEIPLPAPRGNVLMDFCMYAGNQGIDHGRWFFYEVVSKNALGCDVVRTTNYLYYFGEDFVGWTGFPFGDDITALIQPGATSFRVRLMFVDTTGGLRWTGVAGPLVPGYPSEAPYFDNFIVAVRGTTQPAVPLPSDLECPPDWVVDTGPTTVNVRGTVTSGECLGTLAGVPVDLLTAEEDLFTTVTDADGKYLFEGIPISQDPGEVSITPPLGFRAVTPPDAHTSVDLSEDQVVDFTLACVEPSGPARTIGYWKHQASVYLDDRGHAQETQEDMQTNFPRLLFDHFHDNDLNAIAVAGVTFIENGGAPVPITLETIRNTLTVNRGGTMLDRAKQQYLALLLNLASGKLQTYTVISLDGEKTASQALQEVADLILDGDGSNDETAKDIADIINNGNKVPDGMIRDVWSTIPYRDDTPIVVEVRTYDFALAPPHPNPFTPSTGIRFQLARPGMATVRIFDNAGRLVRNLLDAHREAGEHLLTWDCLDDSGSRVPSGVYFLRFQADGRQATRQLTLTK